MKNDSSLASRARRSLVVGALIAALATALVGAALTSTLFPQWWQLTAYFWYAIPSNTFIHLPHEPAAIYAGNIYDPWLVAAVGSLATVFASAIDYFTIKRVFRLKHFSSMRDTSLYRMSVRWFRWKPWATIAFLAFTPIPFDPVRVLAPASNYHFGKYVTANVAGRSFLYYLLAAGGAWLPVSMTYLILIGGCVATMPLLALLWARRKAFIPNNRPNNRPNRRLVG